jgi:hypothetical protein
MSAISFLRDTKSIGELSEMVVATALGRAGYFVAVPFGERQRYDLIIDKDGLLSRVQVKTGRLRNGAILFNCYSVHASGESRLRTYRGAIDFFGVFCPEVNAVFLVPVNEVPAECYASLRWAPTKNGQHSKVRWAQRYLVSSEPLPKLVVVGSEPPDGVTAPSSPVPS